MVLVCLIPCLATKLGSLCDIQVTANWDVSMFEPLRFVVSSEVKDDIEALGEASDFWSLSEEIKACEVSEILFVHDEKKIWGSDFLICTTQTAVAHFIKREEQAEAALVDLATK